MAERPILFSGEMVRVILDGTKTQTRRPVLFPRSWPPDITHDDLDQSGFWFSELGWQYGDDLLPGQVHVGDLLWVRETWAPMDGEGGQVPAIYRADFLNDRPERWKWRPSIHMPRWASRITLNVTAVRVEQVQEISEADAAAEGCPGWYEPCLPDQGSTDGRLPHEDFCDIWNATYDKRGLGWSANPWVWVIEFGRAKP